MLDEFCVSLIKLGLLLLRLLGITDLALVALSTSLVAFGVGGLVEGLCVDVLDLAVALLVTGHHQALDVIREFCNSLHVLLVLGLEGHILLDHLNEFWAGVKLVAILLQRVHPGLINPCSNSLSFSFGTEDVSLKTLNLLLHDQNLLVIQAFLY